MNFAFQKAIQHPIIASYSTSSHSFGQPIGSDLGPKYTQRLADSLGSGVAALCLVIWLCTKLPSPNIRPQWIKVFAREEETEPDVLPPKTGPYWTHWTLALLLFSLAGFILSLVWALLSLQDRLQLLIIIPWTIAIFIIVLSRPVTIPFTLLVVYGVTSFCQLLRITSADDLKSREAIFDIVKFCLALANVATILRMPIRSPDLSSNDISPVFREPTYHLRSPEDNLSPWQFMTVSWMVPLISIGSFRQIHDEDVWLLPYEFQHRRLHVLFRDLEGSVIGRLLKANGLDLVITTCLGAIETVAGLLTPVLLQQLLRSIEHDKNQLKRGLTFAAIILVVRFIAAQSAVFSLWYSRRAYERSRGEMVTMIYDKTLSRKSASAPPDQQKEEADQPTANTEEPEDAQTDPKRTDGVLARFNKCFINLFGCGRGRKNVTDTKQVTDDQAKSPATMGKILNLMRNDVYEVAQRFWEFPNIFTKPLTFSLSVVLIWKLLGWSCLIGMLVVVSAQLINTVCVRALLKIERFRRSVTDVKLNLTTQFIESIRHLRWADWQDHWLNQIMDSRQRELYLRVITNLWNIAMAVTNLVASGFFPVVAFWAYTILAQQPLRVDVAFPALQLFEMLDQSLRELPGLVTVLLNARIAMGRIEEFMSEPDKSDLDHGSMSTPSGTEFKFKNASFSWPGSNKGVLKHLSLEFHKGLNIVLGKVGHGKTALLQAILGELDKTHGDVSIPDTIMGYCAQTPWLQSMSIRENILFCAPFDERRYKQVLDACCLTQDLAQFKHGDLSNLGENGVGLSGGQKARVALARAIYSRAPVLLLDDPLSALDHTTAETIVQKLFRSGSLMEDRTVILVTHRVDLIKDVADQIIEISEGQACSVDSSELTSYMYSSDPPKTLDQEVPSMLLQDEDEASAVPEKFMDEEHRPEGGVLVSVYWQYVKAGGLTWWIVMTLVAVLSRVIRLLNFWFLKAWGEAYGRRQGLKTATSSPLDRLPSPQTDVRPWLAGFALIAVAQAVVFFAINIVFLIITYKASRRLFRKVMQRVSQAPFRFYDVTPVGRLMNRLTSDIGTLDGRVAQLLQEVSWNFISSVSSIVVIASVAPLFLIISCALTTWFLYVFFRFLPTSQSLRRLEMVSLSPLMSNFGALLGGLTTVRAFQAQPYFQDNNIKVVDAFQKMDHFYWSLQAWLMYRFDLMSATSTFALTVIALYQDLSPGLTAFILTAAANFVQSTHALCKRYGQLQMEFVSVERVIELLHLDQEPIGSVDPPAAWPAYGDDIVFENVNIKYAPNLDPALSDVNLRIPGGSMTAVVGRTGSGKSTLALSLLATILPQPGGHIRIGDMDLTQVNVHALRKRITFVAQDPVLFPGSIRQNLDPLDDYTDEECATVLEHTLGSAFQLDSHVEGGGRNLSQGQRQLISLGRAVLRRSAVVILDEATASIDMKTATHIQQVLRRELSESTLITIAHRVEAVKGADYCVTIDKGKVMGIERVGGS